MVPASPPICRIVSSIREDTPGPKWKSLFQERWPAYQRWFLKEGEKARPSYAVSVRRLREHMPELVPVHEELTDLAGGGDHAARMLAMYRPTPYMSGCSQIVWTRGEPVLIRNYDYRPDLWEAVILSTKWCGRRAIVMSDCLWGALDGMNEDGLVVSLTFGGRRIVGDGFGIPLILRYILETCGTAREAAAVLNRVPVHMAYNVSALDKNGDYVTAYVSPGHVTIFRQWPVSTNHQEVVDWKEYVEATASLTREEFLLQCGNNPKETPDTLVGRFFEPPLFSRRYRRGHGTIYTAVYRPERGDVLFMWPSKVVRQGLHEFTEYETEIQFIGESTSEHVRNHGEPIQQSLW